MRYVIDIPNWHPTPLNKLLTCHWAKAGRLKKADRDMVAFYAKVANVPPAEGRRRVSLTITLAPGQRGGDTDAYWKALLDSCVACGLLKNDNRQWCELAPVAFQRGETRSTRIELEDMEES